MPLKLVRCYKPEEPGMFAGAEKKKKYTERKEQYDEYKPQYDAAIVQHKAKFLRERKTAPSKLLTPADSKTKKPIGLYDFIINADEALRGHAEKALAADSKITDSDRAALTKMLEAKEKGFSKVLPFLKKIIGMINEDKEIGIADLGELKKIKEEKEKQKKEEEKLKGKKIDEVKEEAELLLGEQSIEYIKIQIEACNMLILHEKEKSIQKLPRKLSECISALARALIYALATLFSIEIDTDKSISALTVFAAEEILAKLCHQLDRNHERHFKLVESLIKQITALGDSDPEKRRELLRKLEESWSVIEKSSDFNTAIGKYSYQEQKIQYKEELAKLFNKDHNIVDVKNKFARLMKRATDPDLKEEDKKKVIVELRELKNEIVQLKSKIAQDDRIQATLGEDYIASLLHRERQLDEALAEFDRQAKAAVEIEKPPTGGPVEEKKQAPTPEPMSPEVSADKLDKKEELRSESPLVIESSKPATNPTPISAQSQPAKSPQKPETKKPFYSGWFGQKKEPPIVTPPKTVEEKDKKSSSSMSISKKEEENKKSIEEAMKEIISGLIGAITSALDTSEAQIVLDQLTNLLKKYKKQCEELGVNYDTTIAPLLNNPDFTKKAKEVLIRHYLLKPSHTEIKASPSLVQPEEEKTDYVILGEAIQEGARQKALTIRRQESEIIERIDNDLFLTSHDYRQETERMLEVYNEKCLDLGIDSLHLNSKIAQKKDTARKILIEKISNGLLKKHIEGHTNPVIADVKKFNEECKGLDISQESALSQASKISTDVPLIKEHNEILARLSDPKFGSDAKYDHETMIKLENFKQKCNKAGIDSRIFITKVSTAAGEKAQAKKSEAKSHNRFSFWPPPPSPQSVRKEKKVASKSKPLPPTSARGSSQPKK